MAKPIKLVSEINDPDEIKAFLEYMERPATEEEKALGERARKIYKTTKIRKRKI